MMAGRQLDVLVICGSLRKGSYNEALARTLPALAPAGLSLRFAQSFAGFPLYDADIQTAGGFPSQVNAWAEAIRGADALIIVSPEYNWSIPGTLKNAIDWISHVKDQPFAGKPISLMSAAGGLLGGSRMQYHLRQCMVGLDAQVFVRPEIFVTFAAKKFDDKLELTDQPTIDLIKTHLAGFEKYIRRLRAAG